jgi:hypothetical protein
MTGTGFNVFILVKCVIIGEFENHATNDRKTGD